MSIETQDRITRIRPNPATQRASNLAELAAALDQKARVLECAHDARAAFCAAYASDVGSIAKAADVGELGAAGAWVIRVEIEAGQAYLRAIDSWTRGETWSIPAPWRAVFAKSRAGTLSAREEHQISTAAHIGYDVPMAIARAGTTLDQPALRAAFDRVTILLAASMPRAKLLGVLPRRDEFSIVRLRARAFDDGMALVAAGNDAELRATYSRIESRVLLTVAAR